MGVSLFCRKFKIGPFLAKNGQNLSVFAQNNPKSVFFAHNFKVTHQIFLIFLMKPWLYECKKWPFRIFVENSKLALFGPKRPKFGLFWPKNSISLSFDLILTSKFLIGYFLYEIVLVKYFFQYFRLLCGTCDQIFAHFRGSCCVKITKNSSKSIFFNRLT